MKCHASLGSLRRTTRAPDAIERHDVRLLPHLTTAINFIAHALDISDLARPSPHDIYNQDGNAAAHSQRQACSGDGNARLAQRDSSCEEVHWESQHAQDKRRREDQIKEEKLAKATSSHGVVRHAAQPSGSSFAAIARSTARGETTSAGVRRGHNSGERVQRPARR